MQRRTFVSFIGLSPGILATHVRASNATWPTQPVRVFVGFPPGQSSDISARMFGEQLQRLLGQPFVIENRPGAGATLAVATVAQSANSGHVVAFTSNGPLAIAPHLYKNLSYLPGKDLVIASTVARAPLFIVVSPGSKYKTLQDLLAAGKIPNQVTYGSGGNGVTSHLASKMLEIATGASYTHVPYKGTAPALNDLMGGQIQFTTESPAPLLPLIHAGKLRVLATTGSQRYHALPNVPTVAETVPGFEASSWTAFAFPAGTPTSVLTLMNESVKSLLEDSECAKRMRATGVEPFYKGAPQECAAFLRVETDKWGEVIRRGRITID